MAVRHPRTAYRRHLAAAALAGALLAATAGCSGSGSGSSATSSPGGGSDMPSMATSGGASMPASSGGGDTASTLTVKNFAFGPAKLTVRPGAVVTVTNQDSTAHTVTATGAKAFDTGTIAPGKSATFTAPAKPGTYDYICDIHQFMKGTLIVG